MFECYLVRRRSGGATRVRLNRLRFAVEGFLDQFVAPHPAQAHPGLVREQEGTVAPDRDHGAAVWVLDLALLIPFRLP